MRLLVTGSREWTGSWEDIAIHLPEIDDLTVIHGACSRKDWRGVETSVDMIADWAARSLGHHVVQFPADWSLGPKAGPLRNARMLRKGKPDRGLAFGALWREVPQVGGYKAWKPSGTGDMVRRMLGANIPVKWIHAPGADAQDLVEMPDPRGAQADLERSLNAIWGPT